MKKNYRNTRRKIKMLFIALLIFTSVMILTGAGSRLSARAEESAVPHYDCIRVCEGDSLWSIAARCTGSDDAAVISEYVQTLISINGLKRDDYLRVGGYLTVVWYE